MKNITLLIFVLALIISNGCDESDESGYNCNNGQCIVSNENPQYSSLSECQNACNVYINTESQHSCGAINLHNPEKSYGNMTDQQGNVYKTIVIGSQEWMAENLNTSIYRNGDAITSNLTNLEWVNTSNTQIGAWAYPNNDSTNECPYGKLYNWYATNDSRQLCPTGWHVPNDAEWNILINYIDPSADGGNNNANTAGRKMKSTDTLYWSHTNIPSNESGFSGLPAGWRSGAPVGGTFGGIGNFGYWWSSSESFIGSRMLDFAFSNVFRYGVEKEKGLSVRCVKD